MIDKQTLINKLPTGIVRAIFNLWPPLLGTGITVTNISSDYRSIEVRMKLRWYNRNLVGTQFGGSLYGMTDPFYMLMTIVNLGNDYIVWDKAARIDFIKPGRGTVYASFNYTEEEIQAIKQQADTNEKYLFDRTVNIVDDGGQIIASVIKTIYVRKKTSQ